MILKAGNFFLRDLRISLESWSEPSSTMMISYLEATPLRVSSSTVVRLPIVPQSLRKGKNPEMVGFLVINPDCTTERRLWGRGFSEATDE